MTQRTQYGDYTMYLKLKESNNLYNLAIRMIEESSTDYLSLTTLFHKVIILNNNNVDAKERLNKMIDDGQITEQACSQQKTTAMNELKQCYSMTDLRKKY